MSKMIVVRQKAFVDKFEITQEPGLVAILEGAFDKRYYEKLEPGETGYRSPVEVSDNAREALKEELRAELEAEANSELPELTVDPEPAEEVESDDVTSEELIEGKPLISEGEENPES